MSLCVHPVKLERTLCYNSTLTVLPPPVWLKVLALIACYCKSDRELQLATISTLFELISLLKSQLEHSSNPGVTYVVMIPLLKFGHINYLEYKTRIVQVSVAVFFFSLEKIKTIESVESSQ